MLLVLVCQHVYLEGSRNPYHCPRRRSTRQTDAAGGKCSTLQAGRMRGQSEAAEDDESRTRRVPISRLCSQCDHIALTFRFLLVHQLVVNNILSPTHTLQ